MSLTTLVTTAPRAVGHTKDKPISSTVSYDFGDSLQEAVEKFGADTIFKKFKSHAIQDLKGIVRRMLEAGTFTQENIDEVVKHWKPGEKKIRMKSAKDSLLQKLLSMSPSDREAYLKELTQEITGQEKDKC